MKRLEKIFICFKQVGYGGLLTNETAMINQLKYDWNTMYIDFVNRGINDSSRWKWESFHC
jgi:hypothetical protein